MNAIKFDIAEFKRHKGDFKLKNIVRRADPLDDFIYDSFAIGTKNEMHTVFLKNYGYLDVVNSTENFSTVISLHTAFHHKYVLC